MTEIKLDSIAMRILACLVEKQINTPDQYPLTLNSLVNACNQKSSRNPIMSLTIADVGQHLRDLEDSKWISKDYGARAERFAHHVPEKLNLDKQQLAVVTTLMLRGPQTLGEIRTHSERFYSFSSLDEISAILENLMSLENPLCELMDKLPGTKEHRYQQLMCPIDADELMHEKSTQHHQSSTATNANTILERLDALESRVKKLEELINQGNSTSEN